MMGLLGNVAEVKALRPRLMTYQYISVFSNLLGSSSDGIEVVYINHLSCVRFIFLFFCNKPNAITNQILLLTIGLTQKFMNRI